MSTTRLHRAPRRILTGKMRPDRPGAELTCAVLCALSLEWVGVDLASGALVRSGVGAAGAFALLDRECPDGEADARDEAFPSARLDLFDVVQITVGEAAEPADPARPEALILARPPQLAGRLRPRHARRLLNALDAPERDGSPLLGTWGPSIAYVDLDGTSPSAMLIEIGRQRPLSLQHDRARQPIAVTVWGGVTQRLPLLDPRALGALEASAQGHLGGAALAAALGFRPGHLLVALLGAEQGHVRKAVLAVLPR